MKRNEYTAFLCQEARKMGITARQLKTDARLCVLQKGKKSVLVSGGILADNSSASAFVLSSSKAAMNEYLAMHKFPVLKQIKTTEFDDAIAFFNKVKAVVIKPLNQKKGKGITVNVTTRAELKAAWELAGRYSKSRVVEKYYEGDDYRVLVINYKDVYCVKRVPANVIGDGKQTIKQLIFENNASIIPERRQKPIVIDTRLKLFLKRSRKTLETIPKRDEQVFVCGTANIHTGGLAVDCTESLPKEVKKEAITIAKLLKMSVVGVDYISKNLAKRRYILELNSDPGVQLHYFPAEGKPRKPIEAFIKMLFDTSK